MITINDSHPKIALVGSHGVGKTSLATLISKRLGVPLIPEYARIARRQKGVRLNEDAGEDDQKELIHTSITLLHKHLDGPFVADRTPLDALAYHIALFGHDQALEAQVMKEMGAYQYVFYLPTLKNIEGDGVRSTDHSFQREIAKIVLDLLSKNSIPHWRVRGSLEKRIDGVVSTIEHLQGVYLSK